MPSSFAISSSALQSHMARVCSFGKAFTTGGGEGEADAGGAAGGIGGGATVQFSVGAVRFARRNGRSPTDSKGVEGKRTFSLASG